MRRLIVVFVAVLAVLATAGALSLVRGDDSELTAAPTRGERADKPAKAQREDRRGPCRRPPRPRSTSPR